MIKQSDFELAIFRYFDENPQDNFFSLWWMSDFYEWIVKELNLDFNDIGNNRKMITRNLREMVKKELIDSKRTRSGYGGKELYGHSSENFYYKKGFI